jgi:hypothetical protein
LTSTQQQEAATSGENLVTQQNTTLALAGATTLSTAAQSLAAELSSNSYFYDDMNYLYGTTINAGGTQSDYDRSTLNSVVSQSGYVESTFITRMQKSAGLVQGLRLNTTARSAFNREYSAALASSGTPTASDRADVLAVIMKPYYNEANLLNLINTQPTATAAYWELAMFLQGSSSARTDFNFLYAGTIGSSGEVRGSTARIASEHDRPHGLQPGIRGYDRELRRAERGQSGRTEVRRHAALL